MEVLMFLSLARDGRSHAGLRPARNSRAAIIPISTGWRRRAGKRSRPKQAAGHGLAQGAAWALDMGLPAPKSITDRDIPTFARGELPHFAGINTFMKAPYIENVRDVGKYDAASSEIPFDSGTTYRPGTRLAAGHPADFGALYAL